VKQPAGPALFADATLRVELKAALAAFGFTEPTPVQSACLATGLGQDLIVQARTGSGKTLAFGLPILDAFDAAQSVPQALIIAPTRELALQICKALAPMARAIDAQCVALTGGADVFPQLKGLSSPRGPKLVIGTPGRVLDHIKRGSLKPGTIRTVVLDEGDHLLDLGFKDELDAILEAMPAERRVLLFSATVQPDVEALARKHTKDAKKLVIDAAATAHADIEHIAYSVPSSARAESLANLLLYERPERTVVFCATRQQARELSELLPLLGIPAGLISGELEQNARNRALEAFREGRCHVLVATDVAARGIDVPATTHVVHFTLAGSDEAYVHRSGRTGRAGRKGVALSLVANREEFAFQRLIRSARIKVQWKPLPNPALIRGRRVELLAERLLKESPTERTAEAIESARKLVSAPPPGDDMVGLVARLLDAAAELEGEPGYDLDSAIAADAAQAAARRKARESGPPRRGRWDRRDGPPPRGGHRRDGPPAHAGGRRDGPPPRGRDGRDERGAPPRGRDDKPAPRARSGRAKRTEGGADAGPF
jgi:ATP-dependent RNA helicase DeaD